MNAGPTMHPPIRNLYEANHFMKAVNDHGILCFLMSWSGVVRVPFALKGLLRDAALALEPVSAFGLATG